MGGGGRGPGWKEMGMRSKRRTSKTREGLWWEEGEEDRDGRRWE